MVNQIEQASILLKQIDMIALHIPLESSIQFFNLKQKVAARLEEIQKDYMTTN